MYFLYKTKHLIDICNHKQYAYCTVQWNIQIYIHFAFSKGSHLLKMASPIHNEVHNIYYSFYVLLHYIHITVFWQDYAKHQINIGWL